MLHAFRKSGMISIHVILEYGGFMGVVLELPKIYGEKLQEVVKCIAGIADDIGLQEIWLFGSVARGVYGIDSDLDIMLIVEGNTEVVRKIVDDFDFGWNPEVDITVRTLHSLQNSEYAFAKFVLRDKIVLWTK